MLFRIALIGLLLSTTPMFAAEPIPLRAGRLTMVFEPDLAMFRYVRFSGHPVLIGVSAPVRDQYWGTVPPVVDNVRVQEGKDSFTLTFDVSCRQRDIDYFWQGSATGTAQGALTFRFDGEARSEFLRNRIGFCVLHGPDAAGKSCTVESVGGQTVNGHFPTFISPHQPFKDIRAIRHEIAPGVWAKVRMEGDTFEMEDQRNWTDASFKTYCTPLALPFPVRVTKGAKVSQRIELSVEGGENLAELVSGTRGLVELRVSTDSAGRRPLPGIGVRVSSQSEQLSETEITRLRDLHLDHLRVDLSPSDKGADSKLRRAAQQANQLDLALHVALRLSENAEQDLQPLSAVLKDIRPPSTWLLISANEKQVQLARDFLAKAGQRGRLGRGEDTNFTELNRNRPDTRTIDAISFGINPQIHAFDDTSLIETLAIQGDTVRSARQFTGSLPLLISPITLRPQAVNQAPAAGDLPPHVDPRQPTLFGAGWTLGSIKWLAEAGVDSVTYYETVGWLGIMESQQGTPLPERFPSQPGQLFPIFHALRELGGFSGGYVHTTTSADPMSVVGLALEKGDRRRLLVVNLTRVERTASVQGFGQRAALRRLESAQASPAAAGGEIRASDAEGLVVKLPPHGIAVLDIP
jgi:hypothetical protein